MRPELPDKGDSDKSLRVAASKGIGARPHARGRAVPSGKRLKRPGRRKKLAAPVSHCRGSQAPYSTDGTRRIANAAVAVSARGSVSCQCPSSRLGETGAVIQLPIEAPHLLVRAILPESDTDVKKFVHVDRTRR